MALEDVLACLDADIVLVEGFKVQKGYPKIACLRGLPDDCDLIDDLTIAAVGPVDRIEELGIPAFDWDNVEPIADLMEEYG
jgi:molybdopterin-guanine dinucleotide biosynthesis protein B